MMGPIRKRDPQRYVISPPQSGLASDGWPRLIVSSEKYTRYTVVS